MKARAVFKESQTDVRGDTCLLGGSGRIHSRTESEGQSKICVPVNSEGKREIKKHATKRTRSLRLLEREINKEEWDAIICHSLA